MSLLHAHKSYNLSTHTHTFCHNHPSPPLQIDPPLLTNFLKNQKTKTKFKGNPLALVLIPADQDPPTETLQTIAREFNLSETAFIYLNNNNNDHDSAATAVKSTSTSNNNSPNNDTITTNPSTPSWRARIFMTNAELPFAGHPTIGTACHALSTLAPPNSTKAALHIPAGTVTASFAHGVARAAIPHNVHLHSESPFSASDVEALQPGLLGRAAVRSVATVSPVRGMNFVCVELNGLEDLAAVGVNGRSAAVKLDAEWDVGFVGMLFYVRTGEDMAEGKDGERKRVVKLRTRMIEGNLEDPATGSASCAVSALLSLRGERRERERIVGYELTQGVEMGRQSDIGIEVTLNEGLDGVERLEMSGSSVKVMEGVVEYE